MFLVTSFGSAIFASVAVYRAWIKYNADVNMEVEQLIVSVLRPSQKDIGQKQEPKSKTY
jgi:hypothetical protein